MLKTLCNCGKSSTGENGRNYGPSIEEHTNTVHLKNTNTSAITVLANDTKH